MFKGLSRIRKNRKGISIIEFVVVVAIFGILSAVAAPRVIAYFEQEKIYIDNSNAKDIEAAILRNVAKGVISLEDGPVAIREIVIKELGSIPQPLEEGYGFYYYEKTGSVKAMDMESVGEGWKRIY